MDIRKCKKCGVTTNLTSEFWYVRKETNTITTHTCKECVKKASKKSRDNALAKDRVAVNKAAWDKRIQNKYGITLLEYTDIMNTTTICTICGKTPTGSFSDKLVYDHCHITGKFRGVICTKCNVGLGNLGDTSSSVLKGYEYLLKFEEDNQLVSAGKVTQARQGHP